MLHAIAWNSEQIGGTCGAKQYTAYKRRFCTANKPLTSMCGKEERMAAQRSGARMAGETKRTLIKESIWERERPGKGQSEKGTQEGIQEGKAGMRAGHVREIFSMTAGENNAAARISNGPGSEKTMVKKAAAGAGAATCWACSG